MNLVLFGRVWPGLALRVSVLLALLAGAGCVTHTESVFSEPPSPDKALQQRVELARKYIGEGDWENAKRNLKRAARMSPDSPEVHEAFALVYQSTGEQELAEENYRRAIRLDRNFSRARNNYAAFLYSQARYDEAEEQLEYVARDSLYSGRSQAFVNLGLCRLQLFDNTGAEEAFMRALAMDRTNTTALLEMAILSFDDGDNAAADKYYGVYRTAVRQQSPRALWLGIRLAREEGDRNAEGSYALALRNLYPQSPEFQAYRKSQEGG